MDNGEPEWLALERSDPAGSARLTRPYVLPDTDDPYGSDGLSWSQTDPGYGVAVGTGYDSPRGMVPQARSPWHDSLPLIEPPPAQLPARSGRSRGRRSSPRDAPADGHNGHRPPPLAVALTWLDDHRYESVVVLGLVLALSVVGVVVDRALDEPTRPAATDVGSREIPYNDVSVDQSGTGPAPVVPVPTPPTPVVPSALPSPAASVPGAAPVPPKPGPAVPAPAAPGAPGQPAAPPVPRPADPTPAGPPPVVAPPPPPPPPPVTGGRDAYRTIEAESYDAHRDTDNERAQDAGGGLLVGFIANGDFLRYDDVNFGSSPASRLQVRVASGVQDGFRGRVELRLDSRQNAPIGAFTMGSTGDWQAWRTISTSISRVTGMHTVYLTFTADHPVEYANINWFTFTR